MKKALTILFLLLIGNFIHAQLESNNKLIFTSSDSTNRSIIGINKVTDTSDLISVNEILKNRLLFSNTSDNDSLVLNLPFNYNLLEGMSFWLFQNQNTDSITLISINQSNYYPLININSTNDLNCLKTNQQELIIFNGTEFQQIFDNFTSCPAGYVEVNESYCIQLDENIAADYWSAIVNCNIYNAKLCSWSEWYYACQKSSLGLNNMINNWEWTESSNNHATSVLTVGNGTCQTAGESNTQVSTLTNYRCCFRK